MYAGVYAYVPIGFANNGLFITKTLLCVNSHARKQCSLALSLSYR